MLLTATPARRRPMRWLARHPHLVAWAIGLAAGGAAADLGVFDVIGRAVVLVYIAGGGA